MTEPSLNALPTGSFCPDCGAPLAIEPAAAGPARCACGFVRYRNPVVGVAVVVRDGQGRVLLGRRAKGAYAGLWCIPCGYVEWDEDVRGSARREFLEETGLEVELGPVVAVHSNFHNPRQHTVGIWFAGAARGGHLEPIDGELAEVAYFDPAAAPDLAFPTDALVLADLAAAAPGDALRHIDRETSGPRCDVTPLFADAGALAEVTERLAAAFRADAIDIVAGIDALGFVLGTGVALRLGTGMLTIRKGGKLPVATLREEFVDYSGESKALEIRADAIPPGARVLLVDEWVETGAQAMAAAKLIERAGGTVASIATINVDRNAATEALRRRYRTVALIDAGE